MRYVLPALVAVAIASGVIVAIGGIEAPPRQLAPWIEERVAGHAHLAVRFGRHAAGALLALARGRQTFHDPLPIPARGASAPAVLTAGRAVIVGSTVEARRAIDDAQPGDVITFVPGTYRFDGVYVDVRKPGAPDAPITVRADKPQSVVLELDMVEGFLVRAPYWTFENLTIRGVCADHANCEHAFHVVGDGAHFVARNDEIVDFNAQFKINGSHGEYPDFGVIEGNVIRNGAPRDTANPVTPIDLVAASHWRIVGNRISDFVKARGDQTSYGAFAKGGGSDNALLRNVVVCEDHLRAIPGRRVGLSLGGGGSSEEACRDGRCVTEQAGSVIASNLVASCSDDGIYLNRAAISVVAHNTLVDTAGITARFRESSADVDGNLVDGVIRATAGASVDAHDNRTTGIVPLYLGMHPVRELFIDAAKLDLHWRDEPPRRGRVAAPPIDLCGVPRPPQPAYGAFEDIGRCRVAAD